MLWIHWLMVFVVVFVVLYILDKCSCVDKEPWKTVYLWSFVLSIISGFIVLLIIPCLANNTPNAVFHTKMEPIKSSLVVYEDVNVIQELDGSYKFSSNGVQGIPTNTYIDKGVVTPQAFKVIYRQSNKFLDGLILDSTYVILVFNPEYVKNINSVKQDILNKYINNEIIK